VVTLSVLVIGGALASIAYFSQATQGLSTTGGSASSSTSTNSTAKPSTLTPASTIEDALLQVPGLPTLYHEDCASPYPNDTSTTCTTTTSRVGLPQTFNMSTDLVSSGGTWSGVLHEHLFAFELNQSATIQFTMRGLEPSAAPAMVKVYFDNDVGINFTDLSDQVGSGTLQSVTSSSGNGPVDRFSGQIGAHPGVYIFDLKAATLGTGAAYFMLRDATALQQGIQVSLGSPTVNQVAFGPSACGGGPGESFVGEEEFPVTVTANATTNVNLASPNVPYGVWVKFVPSQLENVGPQGAGATMPLAGDVSPFGGNVYNSSLFIDASGSSGGLTGETVLPLDSAYGGMNVLQSAGPVGEIKTPNPEVMFGGQGTAQNQTNYAVLGDVYDPSAGTAGGSSLAVTITGVGLMQNSTEIPPPNWLNVTPASSSFVMSADQPYYLQVCVTISSAAPLGGFTVILDEKVNGQQFSAEFLLDISSIMF